MSDEQLDLSLAVANGVTLQWLKIVFNVNIETARLRLRECEPKRIARGGAKYYDVAEAASYLVRPRLDLEAYLKTLRAADLPPVLQPAVWESKLKRQKWEKNAGDLWPTARVLDVLTEVFKTARVTMQLWVDDLDQYGLTNQQRDLLTRRVDSLQNDLYSMLVAQAAKRVTRSQVTELDALEEKDEDDELGEEPERDWV